MKKCIAIVFLLVLSSVSYAFQTFDDCETATFVNTLGGTWITFNDGYSDITFTPNGAPAYAGLFCRSLDWNLRPGNAGGVYAGAAAPVNASWLGANYSAYAGVRFHACGAGAYALQVGTNNTRTLGNHYSAPFNPAASWQLYEVPFTSLVQPWGTPVAWDPTTVYSVGFTVAGAPYSSGQLRVDNIEFYTPAEASPVPDPNVIILEPKVNQMGYLTGEKKYFTVVTNTASSGDTWRVFDAAGNTVYSAVITGSPKDDRQSTGEGVWRVDFSAFDTPGVYHISVNNRDSRNFSIASNVYDNVFKDSLRCFYLIRCGNITFNDPVTGLNRVPCHTAADTVRGAGGTRDMSGGWHNAGDLGKWAHEEAISAAYMMWLYELKTASMQALNNSIKESGNGVSDLLNEAKWGLDWMLKLQKTDGTVFHKSDTEPFFVPFGTKPEADPNTRYVAFQAMAQNQTPSSIDAAVFTAAMAQAARVYASVLPSYADTCKTAALLSWEWLKNNRGKGQSDPYYTDALSWQEEEWAMAEIFRLTGDSSVSTMFDTDINSHALEGMSWMTPESFGYFSLWQDPKTPQALKDKIKARFITLCDSQVALANSAGYGVARAWTDYYWESNEDLMHKACNLLMGYIMTGNALYKDTALDQLGYILGNNSLDISFVTREGTRYASHPYNWTWMAYGVLIPGWASGGPNEWPAGAGGDAPLIALINLGTPPAKCWLDMAAANGSYASNEGETSENAALVFLSGFFFSEVTAQATPTPEPPTASAQNLDNLRVFPVPFNAALGHTGITFSNLTGHTKLEIFNLNGELVYRTEQDTPGGALTWKITGSNKSRSITSGVYIYAVTGDNGGKKTGKIAVIR